MWGFTQYSCCPTVLEAYWISLRALIVYCSSGTISWVAMATTVTTPGGAVVATIIGSLSTACSDVVVDSIVVERSRGVPQVRTMDRYSADMKQEDLWETLLQGLALIAWMLYMLSSNKHSFFIHSQGALHNSGVWDLRCRDLVKGKDKSQLCTLRYLQWYLAFAALLVYVVVTSICKYFGPGLS